MGFSPHKQHPFSILMMVILVLSISTVAIYQSLSILKDADSSLSLLMAESADAENDHSHSCDEDNLVDDDICLYANSIIHIAFYNHFCIKLKSPDSVSINRMFLDTLILPPQRA